METKDLKHIYLVDGSGYIFRAYYGLPPLTRTDGTPVGAVYGFVNMMLKLRDEVSSDHLAVVFDAGRETFRMDIYKDYKANRSETPEDLIVQFPLIREACKALQLPMVEMKGFEADDLIATYARMAEAQGAKVTIISSDKDLMQLVGGNIEMRDPLKNRSIGVPEVIEKFGVPPEKVVEVQALAGDSSDNVPGVPGIGVKTAAELIKIYGDVETLLERAGEIKQPARRQKLIDHAEDARISKRLVQLKEDVPIEETFEDFLIPQMDEHVLFSYLREQGFNNIVIRLERNQKSKPGDESPAKTYQLVQELSVLEGWIGRARKLGYVGFDTETTSLNAMEADLVGFSLSVAEGEACYVPVAHQGAVPMESVRQIPRDEALKLLKPLLEDPSVLKIGQNLKYDMLVLKKYGIDLGPIDDTMLISYVLDCGKNNHNMDALAERHLGRSTVKYKDVVGTGQKEITFDYVPLDKACQYAAEDADVTMALYGALKPRLLKERMVSVYETLERPLVPVLVEMENEGILVDPERLRALSREFSEKLVVLEAEIHELAGHPFNIASPRQLGEVLFDEMGMTPTKKGKTGFSTSADVLEELAVMGHDLPDKVLKWRHLAKLKSTYSDALLEEMNPKTGRVHTSYGMTIASTGRLSSTDPNLQNIPIRTETGMKIREAFVAKEGHTFVSLDYSQIELRLLAHMADIPVLKEAFREGRDIHAITASQMFGVPVDKVEADLRYRAKAINFGIIYGISAFGLARQLGIPREDAGKYIKSYFEQYPGIQDYVEKTKEFARKHGYVETLFGRRIHIPAIGEGNFQRRNFAERQAVNAPLQGTAADIIKRAMIQVPGALAKNKLAAKLLLQVHDELLFEAPLQEAKILSESIRKIMMSAGSLSVPLEVGIKEGVTWAKAH
ncbi:MAG: DNA polymerase I [Alphaproteobacteria bacterium]|nr:DNA polymerase I [Alphaproteobacteria bacterium]MBT5390313.1 DNA polymerase I [Alphaproteobacteria bacterium]